ncbi:MAG TPA: alpha/beta hydrolase [Gemmatimonadaceae bacterium]|nr:alpha/beta hydrolase [Gemmatimonadaceae bacterium]
MNDTHATHVPGTAESGSARERYAAFRRTQPRSPRLARLTVRARGLDFAVFATPPVAGVVPLVCVNGGMIYSHALLWPALAPLAAGRQVILYDLRGRGLSQVPPGPRQSRVEFDATDLAAIRDAMGITRWDVLGHSWGGGIAMLGAAHDAGGVRRLVLVDAVGATSAWIDGLHDAALARLSGPSRAVLAALDPRLLHDDNPETHGEYSRAIYPAWFVDEELGRTFAPPMETSQTGAAVAARLRRHGYDWRDQLRHVAATTLLVHGAGDIVPAHLAHETATLIPRARVEVIAGAGHMPFWEQPATFFPLVTRFLDTPDRGA